MHIFRILTAAISLIAIMTLAAFQSASAQGIIIIDDMQILQDSKAGKDIQNKLSNIETQINNELEPTRKSLETQAQSLQTKVQGKTREAIAADTALVNELTAFQTKSQEFAQKRQHVAQEFAMTEQKALIDFNRALEPVLLEVVSEKNAQVVLLKGQVVYSADAVDATPAIIAKLDQRTPAIAVQRQRVPVQQPQQ